MMDEMTKIRKKKDKTIVRSMYVSLFVTKKKIKLESHQNKTIEDSIEKILLTKDDKTGMKMLLTDLIEPKTKPESLQNQ